MIITEVKHSFVNDAHKLIKTHHSSMMYHLNAVLFVESMANVRVIITSYQDIIHCATEYLNEQSVGQPALDIVASMTFFS